MKMIIFILNFYILFLYPCSIAEAKRKGDSKILIQAIKKGDVNHVSHLLANYSFTLHEEIYENIESQYKYHFLEGRTTISFLALDLGLMYHSKERIKILEMIQEQSKQNCHKLTKQTHTFMTAGFICIALLTSLMLNC